MELVTAIGDLDLAELSLSKLADRRLRLSGRLRRDRFMEQKAVGWLTVRQAEPDIPM